MRSTHLALAVAIAAAGPAGAQEIPLSGSGTAVLDGVVDTVEWRESAARLFLADEPDGGRAQAILHVMNDATHLYFGLVIVYADQIDFSLLLDANGDGSVLSAGDDTVGFSTLAESARDGYRTPTATPLDTSGGGTSDVAGTWSVNALSTMIELAHPLDSGDAGRDIAVGPDDLLAFVARVRLEPGSIETFFPGAATPGEIRIAAPEPGAAASAGAALLGLALAVPRGSAPRRCG